VGMARYDIILLLVAMIGSGLVGARVSDRHEACRYQKALDPGPVAPWFVPNGVITVGFL
jgi:hypothetical protein